MIASLCKLIFGMRNVEAVMGDFRAANATQQQQLEKVARTVMFGYNQSLDIADPDQLAASLDTTEDAFVDFAYEGAGIGLVMVDFFSPWAKSRLFGFLEGAGKRYIYPVYVGAGFFYARLFRKFHNELPKGFDPVLGWWAIDGYGFHQGYFHTSRFIHKQEVPKRVTGYARKVFDLGIGRSLWFACAANPTKVKATIDQFAPERRPQLWTGAAFASSFAGGVSRETLQQLRILSGIYYPQAAQGSAFAAKCRDHSGKYAAHTALANEVWCDRTYEETVALVDEAWVDLAPEGDLPAYEVLRQRIQKKLAEAVVFEMAS